MKTSHTTKTSCLHGLQNRHETKKKAAQGIAMETHFINRYGKHWMDETYSGYQQYSDVRMRNSTWCFVLITHRKTILFPSLKLEATIPIYSFSKTGDFYVFSASLLTNPFLFFSKIYSCILIQLHQLQWA
jgi:hypothetical protein